MLRCTASASSVEGIPPCSRERARAGHRCGLCGCNKDQSCGAPAISHGSASSDTAQGKPAVL